MKAVVFALAVASAFGTRIQVHEAQDLNEEDKVGDSAQPPWGNGIDLTFTVGSIGCSTGFGCHVFATDGRGFSHTHAFTQSGEGMSIQNEARVCMQDGSSLSDNSEQQKHRAVVIVDTDSRSIALLKTFEIYQLSREYGTGVMVG